jgi:uncharacterized paraquat-inducible protein A
MPLIKCPECSANASVSAPNCPQCGHPIAQSRTESITGPSALLIALGILLGAFTFFYLMGYNRGFRGNTILAAAGAALPLIIGVFLAYKRGFK